MQKTILSPSDFAKTQPFSSILQNKKRESETVCLNIMIILMRTGDEWRDLSFLEYVTERKRDGGFSESERPYFESVKQYCKTPETAAIFCPSWREIYDSSKIDLK